MGSLDEDLGVGGLEGVLGVERAFVPGRFSLAVLLGEDQGPAFACLGDGGGDGGSGFGVVVEEGSGDLRAAGDRRDADVGLLPAKAADGLVDPLESGLGLSSAGRQGGSGAGVGDGVHAMSRSGPSSAVRVSPYSLSSCPASARSVARKAVDHTRWK